MSKKATKAVVKYKPLFADSDSAFKTERSLDTMIFSGSYLVEITHNGADVGLPIEDCGEVHYIVGTLVVTDSGTNGTMQKNRVIGQILSFASRESRETLIYTRTFADDAWSEWRSLALTGMYDSIASTDELLSTVDELVNTTKNIQKTIEYEIGHSKALESQDKKLLCKAYTCVDHAGIWCKNNTTGEISEASTSVNGFLIKVSPGELYRIESASLWNSSSVPFFSDVPTADNYSTVYVVSQAIKGGLTAVPADSAYMLVSVKNPSTATAKIELVGWADKAVSNAVATVPKNLGSEYVEGDGNLIAGKSLDMRHLRTMSVNDGAMLEFIAESDKEIEFLIISNDGKYASGSTDYYKSNVLYKIKLSAKFVTALKEGNAWGLLVKAENAVTDASVHFRARVINDDSFSYDSKINEQNSRIENTKSTIATIANVVNDFTVIPNNNNYIKNWEIGNKLVVRLYVENKELALADKLYIRQIVRNHETSSYGVNFGNANKGWAFSIMYKEIFDAFENIGYICDDIRAKYGKIAICIDWDAVEWTSTSYGTGALTESNLEEIVFDWEEFIKPLNAYAKIAKGSVTEESLADELKEKINAVAPALHRYELFSLGDSLCSGGVWQAKVAELTGCLFDQQKNIKPGAMLSVGGTQSFGNTFDNVLWRTKNLIDQGYITGEGENAIVIFENGNDGYKTFDGTERSVVPTTPIEGYSYEHFIKEGTTFLEEINDKAAVNAVLRLTKTMPGKNLKIETLPTKEGDVTLYIGWAGPGRSYYNVHVVPQATDEETLQNVIDKILEYNYTGITDAIGEDGMSIDFSNGTSNYPVTVEFTDTDNTGMSVSITDSNNAKASVAMYFVGDSVDEWSDTSKWQEGITYSQGWKSSIEMLQRTYPKLHIFVSHFPHHSVTSSEYLLPSGAYDSASYDKVGRMEMMRNMQVELVKIAEFYSLPFLNVFAECGIGINNMLAYYNASANVHPKNEGYYRFGETIAAQLKRYLA